MFTAQSGTTVLRSTGTPC